MKTDKLTDRWMLSWFWASSCYFLFSCPAWLVPPVFCHQYKSSTGEYYCSITYGPTLNVVKCVRKAERRLKIPSLINVNVRFRSMTLLLHILLILYLTKPAHDEILNKNTLSSTKQNLNSWNVSTWSSSNGSSLNHHHRLLIYLFWGIYDLYLTTQWSILLSYWSEYWITVSITTFINVHNVHLSRVKCDIKQLETSWLTWQTILSFCKLFTRSIDELLMNLKCQISKKKHQKSP